LNWNEDIGAKGLFAAKGCGAGLLNNQNAVPLVKTFHCPTETSDENSWFSLVNNFEILSEIYNLALFQRKFMQM